jgi:4'-phosphopantetheinyl transferase
MEERAETFTDGVCQVWWARASSALATYTSLLDPVELERAGAYHRAADRWRFVVGCVVSRLVLASRLGIPADRVPLDRRCETCGAPHGRPRLQGDRITFSVSHSGDRVAVGFIQDALIGVDVEAVQRSFRPEEMSDAVLAPMEQAELARYPAAERPRAFLSYWTRKEAMLKATGAGLTAHLPGVVVSPPDEPPQLLGYEANAVLTKSTTMADLHPGAGYVAALAVVGDTAWTITEFAAEPLLAQGLPR